MTSTTVAQHTSQPLNFGPEWLRALSTPDSATSIPNSGGSTSGNIFKFSATKYRYSKDEILAVRADVSKRLTEATQNEILENLKDVESVFRSDVLEPLVLTPPTAEEMVKMNALSSYISGRTPGGAGRAGNNTQQSSQDPRAGRGSGSMSNGRGGSRGRGGRDSAFGPTRGNSNNNNSDDNGENGNGNGNDDAASSSWSRGNFQSRGGSFGNRVRSFDDREQSHTFRRGSGAAGGGSRQSSDGWRRSRGDDDENEQSEESPTGANGSTSWTSRSGQTRRGGSSSMEQRTKSGEKWTHNDDRSGSSNSYESNQQRSSTSGGWRANSSTSERDLNSRRAPIKRDRMPEWMDDNNDDDEDNHVGNATFEQDGTFTRSSNARKSDSAEQPKLEPQTSTEESTSQSNAATMRQEEEVKPDKTVAPHTDTPVVNVPAASEPIVPQPTPHVQQSIRTWDDDFDHSDLATTVVEATLAEDHDYSPPVSAHLKSRLISMEPTPPAAPVIPQTRAPVVIDDKQWFYKDPQNTVQGPFSSADMERWFTAGYFTVHLPVKRLGEAQFSTIQHLTKELGRLPFRTDVPSLPHTPVQKQSSVTHEPQKFNPMAYATPSVASSTFVEDFLLQQQQQQQQSRQNTSQSMLFNRQTSMPVASNDRKTISSPSSISSQLQAYFNSQQQQQQQQQQPSSSHFSSNSAMLYQQQLQRSMSSTNSQQSHAGLFDDMQRSFRQASSQPSSAPNSAFFPTNLAGSQQTSSDLMARLTQAMQTRDKHQQQEKLEEQRRRELEYERLKMYEQVRLQREEEERRKIQEANTNRQINFDQLTKSMESKSQSAVDFDQLLVHPQSLQYQKEQQAKLEAQQAENVRRYQQYYREQAQQPMFKLSETVNWSRHAGQSNDPTQLLSFADIQKQEQEQERRSREAATFAHQYAKSQLLPNPNSSPAAAAAAASPINKPSSWARTLFADGNNGNSNLPSTPSHVMPDHDANENPSAESSSSIAAYNQQATNAVLSLLNIHPKSRSGANQQAAPWNGTNSMSNPSLQDMQRQQTQNEFRQQHSHPITSGHSSASTPAWAGAFPQPTGSQQTPSAFPWDHQQPSAASKPSNKSSTPWTELKPASPMTATPARTNDESSKNEREAKRLFSTTRTQDALSKWMQIRFKDALKEVDVPTLVQLLKDTGDAREIAEYVQPFVGSVSGARDFANDFLIKRNQLANAEPDLDNERLHALAMAPTSLADNSGSGGDEGFQLASSNGQKKKAKKMKGQKVDGKQLGFTVSNRPEQRDDIEKVPM